MACRTTAGAATVARTIYGLHALQQMKDGLLGYTGYSKRTRLELRRVDDGRCTRWTRGYGICWQST